MNEISHRASKEISPWRIRRNEEFKSQETIYDPTAEATRGETHLRDYWRVLLKRRWLIIVVVLCVVSIAAYVNFTATPLFTASSIIKIEPHTPSVTGVGELYPGSAVGAGPYDYFQTQFALLKSRPLAYRVIGGLALESNKSFSRSRIISSDPLERFRNWFYGYFHPIVTSISGVFTSGPKREPERLPAGVTSPQERTQLPYDNKTPSASPASVGKYLSMLAVKPMRNTRLVEVVFTTPDPRLSEELANAHAASFIKMSFEARVELTKEAREFLDAKTTEFRKKVERAEEAINAFRQKHGIVSLDKGENVVVERLVDINKALTAARADRIAAEALYRMSANKTPEYLSQVIEHGLIQGLKSKLSALQAERARLTATFTADHPLMVEVRRQMDETQRTLNTEIANIVRSIETSFAAARAKEEALQADSQKQQTEALKLKEVGVHYAVLQEEVNVTRALYESVLKRLNETTISNDVAASNMLIAQFAERPHGPSHPKTDRALLMASVVGLVLGMALALLLEYLDVTVNTPDEVARAIALPTLGIVPSMESLDGQILGLRLPSFSFPFRLLGDSNQSRAESSFKELVVLHKPFSMMSESYRTIKTALLLSQTESPPQTILITSPQPSAGKTFTSINLAAALAEDGESVLLIDGDLRRGSCHRLLDLRNRHGLTNVLVHGLGLDAAVQKTAVSGLCLLSRGMVPPNPVALLGSERMKELLDELRQRFSFILIDSPPVLAVSDPIILSILAEAVILVLRANQTTTESAQLASERLHAVRARVLGVVLNAVNVGHPQYTYYRQYYSQSHDPEEEESEEQPIRSQELTGQVNIKPVNQDSEDDLDHGESLPVREVPATVPPNFFHYVTERLSEAMGPMASLILLEKVAKLGESRIDFPTLRLPELLKLLGQEIMNEQLRGAFHDAMAQEVRKLQIADEELVKVFPTG